MLDEEEDVKDGNQAQTNPPTRSTYPYIPCAGDDEDDVTDKYGP